MLKIEYPTGTLLEAFKNDYISEISHLLDTLEINLLLNSMSGSVYTIEQILTSSLSDLIDIYSDIESKLGSINFSKEGFTYCSYCCNKSDKKFL